MRHPHTATYWSTGNSLDLYGQPRFPAPAVIACRWEDKQELFVDDKGEEVVSSAVVYSDLDLDLGGFLFMGESAQANPIGVAGARKIRGKSNVSNLRGTKNTRKVWVT